MQEVPELLQSHYEDPYHRGSCERATHGAQAHDPDSQHFILMQLRVSDGTIEEVWFDSEGCLYCEAPASILAQYCEGQSIEEAMLLDNAAYLALTQLNQLVVPTTCQELARDALRNAISADDDELDGQPKFGGPSLGEES